MATVTDPTPPSEAAGAGGASAAPTQIDRALLTLAGVVVLGTVMAILDTTVVNVAISTLAGDFHTTLPKIQWVATGYTLALATVIPLSGWVADRFGTKRIYMISIALFVVGSALSGLADSSTEIIVFRVLQGLGGGMIMPVGMTILTKAAGPQRIGRVMGIIGVPMLIGPILGPVLGGWLVSDVSWRWIFFINAPIGVLAVIAAWRILPRDVSRTEEHLDLVDLFLASPGLAILIYGIANSNPGGFGQAKVYIPLIIGVVLLAAFVRHALGARFPLIDLRLFSNRIFSASSIALVLMSVSVFGSFLLLQLYLQEARGESALSAGLLMLPQGVGSMLMMPVCGALSDRTGSGRIAPIGLVLVGLSILYLTGVSAHTAYWKFEIDMFINGLGLGTTMMPIFTGAVQTLTESAVARASALLNILQQGGASIGTSVLTVLLASEIAHHLGGHTTSAAGTSVDAAERAHAAAGIAAGFGDTFWWALALIAVALFASFFLPKQKPDHTNAGATPPAMV